MIAPDFPALVGLLLVGAEWIAIGWLAGASWPGSVAAPQGVRVALRLLIGAAIFAAALLTIALFAAPLRQPVMVIVASVALALIVRALARHRRQVGPLVASSRAERWGWAVLGVLLAATLIRAWLTRETGWDAYSHWGLKAKAYLMAGTVVDRVTEHDYYPPLVPLFEAWFYLHRGEANIDAAKLVWAMLGSAFAVAVAWHARIAVGHRLAGPLIAIGVVLASTQLVESLWTGQADLALAVFLSLSVLALFQWQRALGSERRVWMVQAVLFGGAAALCKHEGVYRMIIVAAVFTVELAFQHRPRIRPAGASRGGTVPAALRPAGLFAAGLATIFGLWAAFRLQHGIPVGEEHMGRVQWEETDNLLRALAERLGGLRTGGGLALTALALAINAATVVRAPARLLLLVVLGELVVTPLGLLMSWDSPAQQAYLAGSRLLMQFAPVGLFLAALTLAPDGVALARWAARTWDLRGSDPRSGAR